MKKSILFTIGLFIFFAGSAQTVAQTRCNNFGRGVNLSNWMEGYWETNWPDSTIYNKQFLIDMKAAGIKSVRMPVCFALISDTLTPYMVDTTSRVFHLIDSVINWTADLNMNLIIDNHHLWTLNNTSWRMVEPRLAHLWSVLAQRYNYLDPNQYFFEILNEPAYISNDSLALLFTPIIDTIRQYAPFHSIVVSPTSYSNGVAFINYKPLADTNLIYTVHSYDPFQFTHQGLSFVVPPLPTGVPFPNSGFDFELTFMWEAITAWRDSFHLPLFMGEFGVGIGADAQSRCNWIDTMGTHIDGFHLPAFNWDVKGDFRLFNSGVTSPDSIIPCFEAAEHLYGDSLTAIPNFDDELQLQIFPDPAVSWFTCIVNTGKQAALEVYDNLGRSVFIATFFDRYSVNTTSWSKGVYFVTLKTNGAVKTQRVIVQ